MKIDVSKIKFGSGLSEHFCFQEQMGSLELGGEKITLVEPVQAELDVTGTDGVFWVEGRLKAMARFTCCRCLTLFTLPIEAELREKYFPKSSVEDEEASFYEGDKIYLNNEITRALLVSLPMKPVCSADCKGLCPSCGRDLNTGVCNCAGNPVDPRLAALKKFFSRDQ